MLVSAERVVMARIDGNTDWIVPGLVAELPPNSPPDRICDLVRYADVEKIVVHKRYEELGGAEVALTITYWAEEVEPK